MSDFGRDSFVRQRRTAVSLAFGIARGVVGLQFQQMIAVPIDQAFRSAVAFHHRGDFAEAELLYQQILAVQPEHADALHMLGVLAHQVGQNERAVELIGKAIRISPMAPAFHSNLGEIYKRLGRLDEALAAFHRAIQIQPGYAKAHNNLGAALIDQGHFADAVSALRTAIELRPEFAEAYENLGIALRGRRCLPEAEMACRRAIQLNPNNARANHVLGLVFLEQGRLLEAATAFRRAIEIQPEMAEAHCHLGNALKEQGCLNESVAAYRRALQLKPDLPEALNNLGVALIEHGCLAEAEAVLRRAIEVLPGFAEAHCNLGNALRARHYLDEAILAYHQAIRLKPNYAEPSSYLGIALREKGCFPEALVESQRAIQIQPDYAEGQNNFGVALLDQGSFAQAESALHRAIELKPDYPEAYGNLGNAFVDQGYLEGAEAAYRRAIELKPGFDAAKKNYSSLLLLRGDFDKGWPLYEARWNTPDMAGSQRDFAQPIWRGEPLQGRRILIHTEQGLGDALQFVRYVPLVARRGGYVILECQPEVKVLLSCVEGIAEIVAHGDPLPAFEMHCPMMSLPLAFATRLETIPAAVPYLRADPSKVSRWRECLDWEKMAGVRPDLKIGLKVGIVWAGGMRPGHPDAARIDRRRSLRLSQLAPLAKVPGVVYISLQKGPPATQAQTPPDEMALLDWADELDDFSDTAALVECLDLVISADTAVAHLAGALAKPVWLLNRFDTCWRWLLDREDSPWYPTMRVFRQPRFGDWPHVIERVADELAVYASRAA